MSAPLILAIQPDRRQASQLASIVRGVSAELILAESTEKAIAELGDLLEQACDHRLVVQDPQELALRLERPMLDDGAGTLEGETGSLPIDPAATLTTVGTGGLPSQHGITGSFVRLARQALSVAYGSKEFAASGPIYKSMKREANAIRLTFDPVSKGLMMKGEELRGFTIAGADRKFVWADAKIEGNTVVVSSPKVTEPVAVRYAWATNPICNLFNKEGLPASPFRTDTWPGITVDNH
jgi:sialate O-acetylesterase